MNAMNIHEVLTYLPHRYPFLLIDKVIEIELGKKLVALKNVTINEPFFIGHFPQRPVMPGVLILEALAQATGILAFKTAQQKPESNALYFFAGIDNARFKQVVEPGDQLQLEVEVLRAKHDIWKFKGEASVAGKLVCAAELMTAKRTVQ
jgi:3-hydroxyacyl-[acyl-carrier-protein] dehydratase